MILPAVVAVAIVSGSAEPGVAVAVAAVVSVAVVVAADVAGHQAFVDIALAFYISVPVSVVGVEVDISGRSRFFAFANSYYYSSFSTSVEVVG